MGCDFWMDAQREAPERLGKANERIRQLEAELAEAKRRAAWYLENTDDECAFCINYPMPIEREPCRSCIRIKYDGDKDNFTPAPVPDDFEKATE